MDFITNTLAQIGDLFRSMTPAARMTAGLLLAVLVVSLGYLFTYAGTSADQYLLAGRHFSSSEVQAMAAAWGKAGLNDYEIVGTQIRVPAAQRAKYMGALLDADALPQNWNDPRKKAMKNGSVFASAQDRENQNHVAEQETLSLWIEGMAGIEKASVIYNSREEGGLRPKTLLTAVANVKPLGSAYLTAKQVVAIRNVVAGAIPGMKPNEVVVNDTNWGVHAAGAEAGSPELVDDRYFTMKTAYERQLREKVLGVLSWIPGVRVQATVKLDPTVISHEKTRDLDPKKAVPVSSKEVTGTITSVRRPSRGAPGLTANQPAPNQATALTGAGGVSSQENEKTNESESVSVVSGTEIESEKAGLTPVRETVSISVPSDYLVNEWQRKNPAAEGEESKQPDAAALDMVLRDISTKIKETAGQLLLEVQGTQPEDLVTVHSFQSPTSEPIPEPGIAGQTMSWIANSWQTLAVIGLVAFSLVMLRSFVNSAPRSSAAEPVVAGDLDGRSEESETEPETIAFGGFSEGKSVRDQLADMVKKDPDAAAAILRTWISTPA